MVRITPILVSALILNYSVTLVPSIYLLSGFCHLCLQGYLSPHLVGYRLAGVGTAHDTEGKEHFS